MDFEAIENKLIDYLDGELPADEILEVEKALAESAELRQELEALKMTFEAIDRAPDFHPSGNLKHNFDNYLRSEKNKLASGSTPVINLKNQKENRNRFFLQIAAAAAILLLGIFVGKNLSGNEAVTTEQFADLRSEMLELLQKENSTSGRIRAVNISYEIQPDSEIIDALIQSLNIDKSTNVRLAAMEALAEFADQPKVRTALCESLNKQENPMVQLSLIKKLVQLQEQQAIEHFEKLIEKEEVTPEVKDEAQMGIFKMM